jgi:hypothetical protein
MLTGGHTAVTKIAALGRRLSIRRLADEKRGRVRLQSQLSLLKFDDRGIPQRLLENVQEVVLLRTAGPCPYDGRRASIANIINSRK